MSKKTLTILIILLVFGAALMYYRDNLKRMYSGVLSGNNGVELCSSMAVEDIKVEIAEIEKKKYQYDQEKKDLLGLSTEGGEQISYADNNNTRLVRQIFYGETGKSEASYYVKDDYVFAIVKNNYLYEKPINVDPNTKVVSIEKKEFYLNNTRRVCSWYLDSILQENDADTQDLVNFLLSTLETKKPTLACSQALIENERVKVSDIDSNKDRYTQTIGQVPELTSRGGERVIYKDSNENIKLIRQVFYDEAFQSEINYYLSDSNVFFVTVDRVTYKEPLYIKPESEIYDVLTRDFYLDENEGICAWYLEGELQTNNEETKDFVAFLLSTLKADEN